ncbi:SLAM family member 9-like [Sebastes fasciatus]|uniref:SLAM family member 9-like n=1 Tax=Sebastes fasciatus TaxID=394691 RepID=UPI003D9F7F2A
MMGKLTGLCVLLMAVLNVAVTEDTVTKMYFEDGDSLTLEVRPAYTTPIINILWKFNGNLLAEWVKDVVPLGYYPRIQGRANLTTETGQLIINNMSKNDDGVYSVGINDRVQSESYHAKFIKKVQKLKVVVRPLTCTADSKNCSLTCDSDTTDAEPITYSWKKGDGEWKVSGKDINITRKDDSGVKTFTCRMKNPVSEEESDPEPNPLYKEPIKTDNSGAIGGGVFVGLLFLAGVVGAGVAWIKKKGPFKNRGTNITDSTHGNGQQTSPTTGIATNPSETVPLKDTPQDPKSDEKETA